MFTLLSTDPAKGGVWPIPVMPQSISLTILTQSSDFFSIFKKIHVYECFTCVYVCVPLAGLWLERPEVGKRSFGTGVTGGMSCQVDAGN